MKKLLLLTFILCSCLAYSQNREEIVERYETGYKKTVITYAGSGNSEIIMKRAKYYDSYLKPWGIETYGAKKCGTDCACWGIIKTELFKSGGYSEDKVYETP